MTGLFGIIAPTVLFYFYKIWMYIAKVMNWINTRVILAIIFFLILTPTALIMRLFGKQFLELKWDKSVDSYWYIRERSNSGGVDYEKQFAPGCVFVGTPSHGGFKLSRELNIQIPKVARDAAKYSPPGWYEEDCEWCIPAYYLGERAGFKPEDMKEAERVLKSYYPGLLLSPKIIAFEF